MDDKIFNSYTSPIPPLRYDVDIIPVQQNGESFIYFHDQLGYTTSDFALPYSAQTILSLLDGNRSVHDIMRFSGDDITREKILGYVQFLDENVLLNSPYFRAHAELVEYEYEKSRIHVSNTAGISYPGDPEELHSFLNEAFEKLPTSTPVSEAKALYAPHIDLRVGLDSYVKAFSAIRNLKPKRVILLATSHYSGLYPDLYEEHPFIFSRKEFQLGNGTIKNGYESLNGLIPTDPKSSTELGLTTNDRAHRIEHSIELHLLFLNHLWQHEFQIIPILVGSLDELYYSDDGFRNKQVTAFSSQLQNIAEDDDTFVLVSGDLSHVGRKFGDGKPARAMFDSVKKFDELFLEFGAQSNAQEMLKLMRKDYDPYRICGFPPLYTFLRTFPDLKGEILTHDLWDEEERESAVSFGSILFK